MSRIFYHQSYMIIMFVLSFVMPVHLAIAQSKATDQPLFYPLNIMQDDGTLHEFQVEYPKTHQAKAKGLMFRTFLPADKGMIFYYPKPQHVAMWMENTFISLDMLFIAPANNPADNQTHADSALSFAGQIVHIATDTVPLSRASITTNQPVIAVIELRAGEVGKRNLQIGDKIYWNLKKPSN